MYNFEISMSFVFVLFFTCTFPSTFFKMMMHIFFEYGVGSVYVSGHTGVSDIQIPVKDN